MDTNQENQMVVENQENQMVAENQENQMVVENQENQMVVENQENQMAAENQENQMAAKKKEVVEPYALLPGCVLEKIAKYADCDGVFLKYNTKRPSWDSSQNRTPINNLAHIGMVCRSWLHAFPAIHNDEDAINTLYDRACAGTLSNKNKLITRLCLIHNDSERVGQALIRKFVDSRNPDMTCLDMRMLATRAFEIDCFGVVEFLLNEYPSIDLLPSASGFAKKIEQVCDIFDQAPVFGACMILTLSATSVRCKTIAFQAMKNKNMGVLSYMCDNCPMMTQVMGNLLKDAAVSGNTDIMQLVLDTSDIPAINNMVEMIPAVAYENINVIKVLADVQSSRAHEEMLIRAARDNKGNVVRNLLRIIPGLKANCRNNMPINVAAANGSLAAMRELLAPDVNCAKTDDICGKVLVTLAKHHTNILQVLVQTYGTNPAALLDKIITKENSKSTTNNTTVLETPTGTHAVRVLWRWAIGHQDIDITIASDALLPSYDQAVEQTVLAADKDKLRILLASVVIKAEMKGDENADCAKKLTELVTLPNIDINIRHMISTAILGK